MMRKLDKFLDLVSLSLLLLSLFLLLSLLLSYLFCLWVVL
jgi:hypothetical protein